MNSLLTTLLKRTSPKLRCLPLLLIGCWASPAYADVGDIFKTVDLPLAARCTEKIPGGGGEIGPFGTSVAVVPGSLVGQRARSLLVTSCLGPNQRTDLMFIDPEGSGTGRPELVKILTAFMLGPDGRQLPLKLPGNIIGWGALALRGDRGDLLACGSSFNGEHVVATIDISPHTIAPDGLVTQLFTESRTHLTDCTGIAWDTSDGTIYQTVSGGQSIYRYDVLGTVLERNIGGRNVATISTPRTRMDNAESDLCFSGGLAMSGDVSRNDALPHRNLYILCDGFFDDGSFQRINVDGLFSNPSAGTVTLDQFPLRRTTSFNASDAECDPHTYSSSSKEVIWTRDINNNRLIAFEVKPGTCGLGGGAPARSGKCQDGSVLDTDGDGLLDCWERDGIDWDNDGTVDFRLDGADPMHRDLYLEIDYMALHRPDPAAISQVTAAFANSPVQNPDRRNGVTVHLLVDEQATDHNDALTFVPCSASGAPSTVPDFDAIKNRSFGTAAERAMPNSAKLLAARKYVYRYALFAHSMFGKGTTSGCSELPGNDFVVTLGGWSLNPATGHAGGSTDQQSGTLLHELGHAVNLRHGGADNINCKPNYLSVMSYTRQFSSSVPGRPLDYSRTQLFTLDEKSLYEAAGFDFTALAGQRSVYGPSGTVAGVGPRIDWNGDGIIDEDRPVSSDINFVPGVCGASPGQILNGFNDWPNVIYGFRLATDFADGVRLSPFETPEITAEEAALLRFPSSVAGGASSVQCTAAATAPVLLDGTKSEHAKSTAGTNDAIVSFEWFKDYGSGKQQSLGTGQIVTANLPAGIHSITLVTTDADGHKSLDTVLKTVNSTQPPTLKVELTPAVLTLVDGKLANVTAKTTATPSCGGPVTVTLQSITVDEAEATGDVEGANFGTEDYSFQLRAGAGPRGELKTYKVTYLATDASGLKATASATVTVPAAETPFAAIAPVGGTVLDQQLQLDGSKSVDPKGSSLTYSWRAVGRPAAVLQGNTATPIVQLGSGPGEYTFELTVTNAAGASNTARITVNYSGR